MFTFIKTAYVSSVFLLLSACGQTLTPLNKTKVLPNITNENTGYILFAVQSESMITAVNIGGKSMLRYQPKNNSPINNYILAAVPSGNYYLDSIKTGLYNIKPNQKYPWAFTVKPGIINYIGHIELLDYYSWSHVHNFELVNKSSFALEYMQKKQAKLLAQYPISYEGPGEDNFLQYAYQTFISKSNTTNTTKNKADKTVNVQSLTDPKRTIP